MKVLLFFLYVCIGAAITFALYFLRMRSKKRYDEDGTYCVMIGLSWPISAPFAFALHFANEMSGRK